MEDQEILTKDNKGTFNVDFPILEAEPLAMFGSLVIVISVLVSFLHLSYRSTILWCKIYPTG